MKSVIVPFLLLVLVQIAHAEYEAHEWGTFTSLVGSDGKTVTGMYHEDEVLPSFVHKFGETRREPEEPLPAGGCRGKGCFNGWFFEQNSITQKMETPVIYFYSTIPQHVDVKVRFPKGIITETFPAPIHSYPRRRDVVNPKNGEATFSVDLRPASRLTLPAVPPDNIYGHARNVNSAHVVSGDEVEKFIFYRGLGDFSSSHLQLTSSMGGLLMQMTRPKAYSDHPQAAILVDVDASGNTKFMILNRDGDYVDPQAMTAFRTHAEDQSQQARRVIVRELERSGLYEAEADAMFDTWQHGYLKVPGLRLLYVLPRSEVEEILPLSFTPEPSRVERVFVGRIEIMLDTDEDRILERIIAQRENFDVSSLGRFCEPMLRRVAQRYSNADPEVKKVLEVLVQRAALRS